MPSTRRDFLKHTGTLAAAGAIATSLTPTTARAAASDRIVVGFIGLGGQGKSLLGTLFTETDVEIAWLCDPDTRRLDAATTFIAEGSDEVPPPARPPANLQTTGDMRRVLDDKAVNAVFIATPDHWHGPATLLALAAGKHVYVEKPASHNLREGRLMVEAARRSNLVCQVGTQSRSTEHVLKAMQLLKEGVIGEVLVSKAWNSQHRHNIGRKPPVDPPKELDYETWLGPVPFTPFTTNKIPYHWRWFYDYGTGDIGNDGVHDIDIARWGLGVGETHPNRVAYVGGQLVLRNTDQQWPDTYYVSFDYDLGDSKKKHLIYEQRTWSPYLQEGADTGNAFYGTKGQMILGKEIGWKIIGTGDIPGEKMSVAGVELPKHTRNFLDCVKTGDRPNADIEIGHISSSLAHLGNIASRAGQGFRFDPKTEQVIGDDAAGKFVRREYREHWGTPKGA